MKWWKKSLAYRNPVVIVIVFCWYPTVMSSNLHDTHIRTLCLHFYDYGWQKKNLHDTCAALQTLSNLWITGMSIVRLTGNHLLVWLELVTGLAGNLTRFSTKVYRWRFLVNDSVCSVTSIYTTCWLASHIGFFFSLSSKCSTSKDYFYHFGGLEQEDQKL